MIGTRSRFSESNGASEICYDAEGRPLHGEVITGEGVILRFNNGLLDGDIQMGKKLISLPAVEMAGHLEWWRAGRLHRDSGLPAVISDNFTVKEWWINGLKIS